MFFSFQKSSKPGDYVLIEVVMPNVVTAWNPDAKTVVGDRRKVAGGRKIYSAAVWSKAWNVVALK